MNTVFMHCSLTKISISITLERDEKCTNKGTDQQYIVGSSIHSTTFISGSCTKFQNSRSNSY